MDFHTLQKDSSIKLENNIETMGEDKFEPELTSSLLKFNEHQTELKWALDIKDETIDTGTQTVKVEFVDVKTENEDDGLANDQLSLKLSDPLLSIRDRMQNQARCTRMQPESRIFERITFDASSFSMTSDSDTDSDLEDLYFYYKYRQLRKARSCRRNPPMRKNLKFVVPKQLKQNESEFSTSYGMSKDSYFELVKMIAPAIKRMDTKMRECVPAEERILITLRYLVTGCTFVSLSSCFGRGESTVGAIVRDTTKVIWNVLSEIYMPVLNENQWKIIADNFEKLLNLPNCIGAIGRKHIQVENIPKFGNKSFHATILMACCDTDGLFTMIKPRYVEQYSNEAVFSAIAIKLWMANGGFKFPSPSSLKYDDSDYLFPYYFAGNGTFPLLPYLMRPFAARTLNNKKKIFNHRLSRGSKAIEWTFKIAAEKFTVLNEPIRCKNAGVVNDIVKAACILHNYVRKREGVEHIPADIGEKNEISASVNMPRQHVKSILRGSSATSYRNYLADYFLSPRASLLCDKTLS